MKIGIRYEARYTYDKPASFSPHLIRLFPKADRFARVDRLEFLTDGAADVQYRRDMFDNEIAKCFYPEKRDTMIFHLQLDIRLTERNPFQFLLDSHALQVPFDYTKAEAAVLAPYMNGTSVEDLPDALRRPETPRPTVEVLIDLNAWIFENLEYERREEGEAMKPEETLARGKGACRDFSVLLMEVLRSNGLASRLASGFLWEPEDTEDRKAESALHAWVEAYIPGAGWIGLDPTNGVLCDHHRITAAVGLTPEDITPVKGFYYGKEHIPSQMDAGLEIVEL